MNAPVNPWAWYKAALKDPKLIGTPDLPVHENEVHVGYFRMKKGKGERGWIPVAILNSRKAKVGPWEGGMECDPGAEWKGGTIWTFCCEQPISYDVYQAVAVRGEPFPDSIEHLIVKKPDPKPEADRPAPAADAERGVGDNSAKSTDPFAELQDRLQEAVAKARAELKAAAAKKPAPGAWNEEAGIAADRLANFSSAIAAIAKEVATVGEMEKAPLFSAHKAAVAKWKPLEDLAKSAIQDLKDASTFFLKAKRDYERAEAEKAAEEERRRQEAANPGIPDFDPAPVQVEAPKVAVGTAGRKVSLVEIVTAKVYDRVAYAGYLFSLDNELTRDLERWLQTIANRQAPHVHKGMYPKPPGIEIVVEEKAR